MKELSETYTRCRTHSLMGDAWLKRWKSVNTSSHTHTHTQVNSAHTQGYCTFVNSAPVRPMPQECTLKYLCACVCVCTCVCMCLPFLLQTFMPSIKPVIKIKHWAVTRKQSNRPTMSVTCTHSQQLCNCNLWESITISALRNERTCAVPLISGASWWQDGSCFTSLLHWEVRGKEDALQLRLNKSSLNKPGNDAFCHLTCNSRLWLKTC